MTKTEYATKDELNTTDSVVILLFFLFLCLSVFTILGLSGVIRIGFQPTLTQLAEAEGWEVELVKCDIKCCIGVTCFGKDCECVRYSNISEWCTEPSEKICTYALRRHEP